MPGWPLASVMWSEGAGHAAFSPLCPRGEAGRSRRHPLSFPRREWSRQAREPKQKFPRSELAPGSCSPAHLHLVRLRRSKSGNHRRSHIPRERKHDDAEHRHVIQQKEADVSRARGSPGERKRWMPGDIVSGIPRQERRASVRAGQFFERGHRRQLERLRERHWKVSTHDAARPGINAQFLGGFILV